LGGGEFTLRVVDEFFTHSQNYNSMFARNTHLKNTKTNSINESFFKVSPINIVCSFSESVFICFGFDMANV
jgi:hypothetical protein